MAALVDSEMCSRVPVIVILGATGSGKSKLGIEIARRFGGEILSADSMQAYKGLDIITNKVTAEERAQAPHHLLDVVTPPRPFSVVEFRDAALPIVERLLQQNKLPVVVGGTNYYIESLLWRVLVAPEPDVFPSGRTASESECAAAFHSASDEDGPASPAAGTSVQTEPIRESVPPDDSDDASATAAGANGRADAGAETADSESEGEGAVPADAAAGVERALPAEPLLKRARLDPAVDALPSPELHRRLQEVDPDMARRLHPNNRRRIVRIT
ncbi:hypothetical protein R5R35_002972 [Gryllus longicercus]|uniref:Uncharacterized protein n=1 Tax=Gryllus longicercus TaxID=2509291 RepID=A0AAN9VJH2_9ORTH